jgi:mRNA interferase MazF
MVYNQKFSGSVQQGHRPVLIISNNLNNKYSSVVTVVPITSKPKTELPVHVDIPGVTNKNKKNTVLCEQISTIPKTSLKTYKGYLNKYMMEKVETALKIQLGIIPAPINYINTQNPPEDTDDYKKKFLEDAAKLTDAQLAKQYSTTANAVRTKKISYTTYFNNKN